MIELTNVSNYLRVSKGKVKQFYISDEEFVDVINNLPEKYKPYNLILTEWDGNNIFNYFIIDTEDFNIRRKGKINRFFLLNYKISAAIQIPKEPIVGGKKNHQLLKYFLYNGLIDIQLHQIDDENLIESSISMIDKYIKIGEPKIIYDNNEYLSIYNHLQKRISKKLVYKSIEQLKDGSLIESKFNNLSEGFARLIDNDKIKIELKYK